MKQQDDDEEWKEWTVERVIQWIQTLNIKHDDKLIQSFIENEIDGPTFEYWFSSNKNVDEILKEYLNIGSMRIRMQLVEAMNLLVHHPQNSHATSPTTQTILLPTIPSINSLPHTGSSPTATIDLSSVLQNTFEDFVWQRQSLLGVLPELGALSSELRLREQSNLKRLNEDHVIAKSPRNETVQSANSTVVPTSHLSATSLTTLTNATTNLLRSKIYRIMNSKPISTNSNVKEEAELLNLLDSNTDLIRSEDLHELEKAINDPIMILVMGDLKAGKSCFINALLKEEILPSTAVPCTSTIVHLKYGEQKMIKIHYRDNVGGTSSSPIANASAASTSSPSALTSKPKLKDLRRNRQSNNDYVETIYLSEEELQVPNQYIFLENEERRDGSPYKLVEVYWPSELLKYGIELVDTPGLNESDLFDNIVHEYIPKATAICCLINCEHTVTDSLRVMLKKSRMKLKQMSQEDIFFICNKYEYVDQKNRDRFKSYILSQLGEIFPDITSRSDVFLHTISAKDAITSIRDNTQHPLEFTQMQYALVNFIKKTFDRKIYFRYGQVRDSIRKCEKFILQQRYLAKSEQEQRELYLQKLEEAQESLKKWIVDSNVVIQQAVKDVQAKLVQFWSSCYQKLKSYIQTKLTQQSAKTTTELKFRSDLNEHLESLFDEFFHSEIIPITSRAKTNMLQDNSQKQQTLNHIFLSLQQIQSLSEANDGEIEHENIIHDVDYRPSFLSEMGSCYRSVVGQAVLWQVLAAPFLFPYSTVIFLISGPTTHFYDEKLYRQYAKKLVQAQLQAENIAFAANQLLEHLVHSRDILQEVCQSLINNEKYMIASMQLSVLAKQFDFDHKESQLVIHSLKEKIDRFATDCLERHWKFDHKQANRICCLGRGNLGVVHLVEYKGKKYAMKEIFRNRPIGVYLREAVLLSELKHDNLVQFEGADNSGECFYILTMYCPNGTLVDYVKQKFSTNYTKESLCGVLDLLIDICNGMSYLHDKHIVHRDIKPENILIDEQLHPRVCDFGSAKRIDDITGTLTGYTPAYQAPELFNHTRDCSSDDVKKYDIYSFGILTWECISQKSPYSNIVDCTYSILGNLVREGVRPDVSLLSNVPAALVELIQACWATNPSDRPDSFQTIKNSLNAIRQELLA